MMQWVPHVTVATVVEQNGKFLLVHEQSDGLCVYNQPAGHWDEHESLMDAARRETLEETGWEVELSHVLGISHYISPLMALPICGLALLRNHCVRCRMPG